MKVCSRQRSSTGNLEPVRSIPGAAGATGQSPRGRGQLCVTDKKTALCSDLHLIPFVLLKTVLLLVLGVFLAVCGILVT